MSGRAVAVLTAAVITVAAGCGGSGGDSDPKVPAGDVKKRAARFAECAKKSPFEVVVPRPPNERTDFLHQEGFEFAEVDLEEQPLLFFAAIVDFFPNRSQASRARDKIATSSFGPPPVRLKDVVVSYTDEPETPKRRQVEEVVVGCLPG
jgi:hypothetical protein